MNYKYGPHATEFLQENYPKCFEEAQKARLNENEHRFLRTAHSICAVTVASHMQFSTTPIIDVAPKMKDDIKLFRHLGRRIFGCRPILNDHDS